MLTDLILLDLMLPDGRGVGILKTMRAPGRSEAGHHLDCARSGVRPNRRLNVGANDYLVKAFDLADLSARIGSVARRCSGNPNKIITHGTLDIDLASRSVCRDGGLIQLTAREWALSKGF